MKPVIYIFTTLLFTGFALYSAPTLAQQETRSAGQITAPEAKPDIPDEASQRAKKDKLIDEIHEFNPIKPQIHAALEEAVQQFPKRDQRKALLTLKRTVNVDAIVDVSKQAMRDLYTYEEIKILHEYYSHPEAISISEKTAKYGASIQSIIYQQLDMALAGIGNRR